MPPALRRMRIAMTAGIAGVLLLLAVFAYLLLDAQRQEREDVEQRFRDVAQVSAALTNGIFEASRGGTVQRASARLGGPRVDPVRLERLKREGRSAYVAVYDMRGRRLATSSGAPARAAPPPVVLAALRTRRARLSDVIGSGPGGVVQWAIPFRGQDGTRVQLTAIPLPTLGAFMSTFLARVPTFAGSESVVVDRRGVVLGGSNMRTPLGRPIANSELLRAVRSKSHGPYGDSWFAASPIAGSSWTIAIRTTQDDLYDTISGERRTIPWLLFAAFALTALVGLWLMRRAALAAAEVQRRQISERHAVEINDNIIQGLALASYELERGGRMAGSSQVAETLREAQRLVSQLLGEGEVQPGQLRRGAAARTDTPGSRGDGPGQAPSSPEDAP